MGRTLRSKKLRSLLYYSQDGKCAICGCDLSDDWHADHIIPHVVTQRTNVHEMQSLCPTCNWEKGKRMLRGHQREMQMVARRIKAGEPIKTIIASVTPGGGKSALPVILAKELIPSFADAICWVVPRNNLQVQGEKSFTDHRLRTIITHANEIRISTNDINPSRDKAGHITTYQSLPNNGETLRYEFDRKRYILFLDEPHHVQQGGSWAKALQPLIDKAVLVVYASGTFERHDKKPIAFLPYLRSDDGLIIDMAPAPSKHVIKYSRSSALHEKAIVPLTFEIFDGRAEYIDSKGEHQRVESIEKAENGSDALHAVLSTNFAYELMAQCFDNWKDYRQYIFPKAKLLVVAPSIFLAKDYGKWLESHAGIEVPIAVSEDNAEASMNIARLRNDRESMKGKGEVDILITVGMAYEGLDCPEITHVACLTRIRSKPWLEQCFARANRTKDGKVEGFIYGPADPLFIEVMDQIKQEQAILAKEVDEELLRGPSGTEKGSDDGEVLPIDGEVTKRRSENLTGDELTYGQTAAITDIMRKYGIVGSAISFTKAAAEIGIAIAFPDEDDGDDFVSTAPRLTASQREERMRTRIERYQRRAAFEYKLPPHHINYELIASFNKKRSEMTESELASVWAYLQRKYPINGQQNSHN